MEFGRVAARFAVVIFALGGCALPIGAKAASFDCRKASSPTEKAVCSDPALSKLDDTLANRYADAMKALSDDGKRELRNGERRWLRFVQDICFRYRNDQGGPDCVRQMYENRVKDLDAAAMPVGPFLFSRIDYFFAREDNEFGRPFQGQTSYPRIDKPQSELTMKWNAIMAPKAAAEGDGWCEGKPGDITFDFAISSATSKTISVSVLTSEYCHGAPHAYGGTYNRTYVLIPAIRLLTADDLFGKSGAWQDLLIERCIAAIKEKSPGANVDRSRVAPIVGDPKAWSLTGEGLVVTINPYEVMAYAFGTTVVTIPWDDLRPFLVSDAPIPNQPRE